MKNSIKVERARHNLTQGDLAEKVGVSRQTINSIETKKYVPSAVLALKSAHVFQIQYQELFQLEEDNSLCSNPRICCTDVIIRFFHQVFKDEFVNVCEFFDVDTSFSFCELSQSFQQVFVFCQTGK